MPLCRKAEWSTEEQERTQAIYSEAAGRLEICGEIGLQRMERMERD